jgi:folate-binding protein YgfZ
MQTRLPDSAVLQLTGADAMSFAHAQFMSDVTALTDGGWQWSGWLTPKGRLIAFFACCRVDAQSLLLWLPAGGADKLAPLLQRFVFRAKVEIDPHSGWHAVGRFNAPADHETGVHLQFPAEPDGSSRSLLLTRAEPPAPDDAALIQQWRQADLRLGIPYISPDQPNSDQFVPQWLSLERLDAFHLKKGCYPGQEIVARMHFLGQSKRAAFRLTGQGDCPEPMTRILSADNAAVGNVVWSTRASGQDWLALAALSKEQVSADLKTDAGQPVRLSP